jgi:hypothetical protein
MRIDAESRLAILLGTYPAGPLGVGVEGAAQGALMAVDQALLEWAAGHPEVSEERCSEIRRELVKMVAIQLLTQI